MKLAIVSDKKTNPAFFPELAARLSEQVLDIEVVARISAFPADIPFEVKKLAADCEAVFVFSIVEGSLLPIIVSSLIGLELETGLKIIKAVKSLEETEQEMLGTGNEETAEHFAGLVIESLFGKKVLA